MKLSLAYAVLVLGTTGGRILVPSLAAAMASGPAPWTPDLGDGTYRNPVLFADYSDPDAVRVGDDFYLVSSSFNHVPGLPILHSRDLVNWTLIGHALPALIPTDHFATVRPGEGVWAPSIRYHAGKFWIFYPDPDFGIYAVTATDPAGAWSAPVIVKAGRGLIDPCPLWDDDGRVYLVHGWAKSRAGKNNLLTLNELSSDGTRVLDGEGTVVIDENTAGRNWTTLEGPKIYRHGGYYWIFAPVGGVTGGTQAVYRSKTIRGPYEARIVLEQGRTAVNGPHQGAWVDTAAGESWFLHFQDRGPYGRVVHLEPMAWRADGWPVIGDDPDGDGKGEPVIVHRKPAVAATEPVAVPATSDEFNSSPLGLQWQWQANGSPPWASLAAQPGSLRLSSVPAPATDSMWLAPNLLMQKFPAPAFTATTVLKFAPAAPGECSGLVVFGYDYAWIGLRRTAAGFRLVEAVCRDANNQGREREIAGIDLPPASAAAGVQLRVSVDAAAKCRFSYSLDGRSFVPLGDEFTARISRWVGAKVGVFALAGPAATSTGHADFDWFRVSP
ncbi:MAG TPA: glycoside hydrolase 43 family protein [Opitutaceae bacterium]|nr:glycoside hydrolase 43 family protein [Opitutaceae bacterium]